jgi:hypothetical protein
VHKLIKTIILMFIGTGNTGNSDVSAGGGGGRTAIQLTNGVDAVVAGGGGGGAACYACSGVSGTYTLYVIVSDLFISFSANLFIF